jgi:hypothetical protein
MPDNSANFEIIFKTIADQTGITAMKDSLESLNGKLQSIGRGLNEALALVGLGLGIQKLNELADMAQKAREQQITFTNAVLRSKDGSQGLVETLNNLNEVLDKTTGTNRETSQAIEQQLATTRLSGDQITRLTPAIINFAAATNQSATSLADVLSRRLRGAIDDNDLSLQKFGITAKNTEGIIAQVGAIGGDTAAKLFEASGGIKQYDSAVHDLQLSVGRLVLLFKIPFLATFTAETESSRKTIEKSSQGFTEFGAKVTAVAATIASVLANLVGSFKAESVLIYEIAKLVPLGLELLVKGTLDIISKAIELAVVDTVTALDTMVSAAADAINRISGGAIKIDTSGLSQSLGDIATKAASTGKSIREALGGPELKARLDETLKAADDAYNKLDEIMKRPDVDAAKAVEAYKKYAAAIDALGKIGQRGSGVIAPGADTAGAEQAAADALTQAKYRLAAAQGTYEAELERTAALVEAGDISVSQADERARAAIQDYIAKLHEIQAELPGLIAQQERFGDARGVAELKLELIEIDKLLAKAQINLGNTTFFGKIHSQLTQLKNDWSDLGKQVGQFLVQQFTAFANTAGQAIAGLIFRTGNWKQAILQLGESFVAQLATMVIQTILARTVLSALNRAFGQADQQAVAAQGQAAAAAWAPGATAASIASYGAAAGAGLAAYLAAIGIGTAGTVAAAGVGGGLERGGYTFGREGQFAGFVHGEEFVFSAPAVRNVGRDLLESMHSVAVSSPSRDPGSSGGRAGGSSGRGGDIHIFNFTDMDALRKAYQRSGHSKKFIIDTVNGSGGNLRT